MNVRYETTEPLEINIGSELLDIGCGDFFGLTPKVKTTKAKINKWDYIKLESSSTAKEPINKWKNNLWNERKYL